MENDDDLEMESPPYTCRSRPQIPSPPLSPLRIIENPYSRWYEDPSQVGRTVEIDHRIASKEDQHDHLRRRLQQLETTDAHHAIPSSSSLSGRPYGLSQLISPSSDLPEQHTPAFFGRVRDLWTTDRSGNRLSSEQRQQRLAKQPSPENLTRSEDRRYTSPPLSNPHERQPAPQAGPIYRSPPGTSVPSFPRSPPCASSTVSRFPWERRGPIISRGVETRMVDIPRKAQLRHSSGRSPTEMVYHPNPPSNLTFSSDQSARSPQPMERGNYNESSNLSTLSAPARQAAIARPRGPSQESQPSSTESKAARLQSSSMQGDDGDQPRAKRLRVLMTTQQQSHLYRLWREVSTFMILLPFSKPNSTVWIGNVGKAENLQTKFPSSEQRERLAARIDLTPRQVQVWFQVCGNHQQAPCIPLERTWS